MSGARENGLQYYFKEGDRVRVKTRRSRKFEDAYRKLAGQTGTVVARGGLDLPIVVMDKDSRTISFYDSELELAETYPSFKIGFGKERNER